jgi:hypothetical protein
LNIAGFTPAGIPSPPRGDRRWSQLFYLSRIMGTSMTQIDATYGHLVPDSAEYLRGLLNSYDHHAAEAAEGGAR